MDDVPVLIISLSCFLLQFFLFLFCFSLFSLFLIKKTYNNQCQKDEEKQGTREIELDHHPILLFICRVDSFALLEKWFFFIHFIMLFYYGWILILLLKRERDDVYLYFFFFILNFIWIFVVENKQDLITSKDCYLSQFPRWWNIS